jgi:hypothetical protein
VEVRLRPERRRDPGATFEIVVDPPVRQQAVCALALMKNDEADVVMGADLSARKPSRRGNRGLHRIDPDVASSAHDREDVAMLGEGSPTTPVQSMPCCARTA